MEKMNYIEKKNQNHDKRSILIHLTKLGKEKTQLVKQICLESDPLCRVGIKYTLRKATQ